MVERLSLGEESKRSAELLKNPVVTGPVSIGGNTTVAVLLVVAGFVPLAVSVLRHGPISQREMIAIAFGVALVIIGAYGLTSRRACFIFDDEFFIDQKFGLGKVRWQDIMCVRWNTCRGLPYLYVTLRHPRQVPRWAFYAPTDAEPNEAVLPVVALEVRVDVLVKMMQERIDRARLQGSE